MYLVGSNSRWCYDEHACMEIDTPFSKDMPVMGGYDEDLFTMNVCEEPMHCSSIQVMGV